MRHWHWWNRGGSSDSRNIIMAGLPRVLEALACREVTSHNSGPPVLPRGGLKLQWSLSIPRSRLAHELSSHFSRNQRTCWVTELQLWSYVSQQAPNEYTLRHIITPEISQSQSTSASWGCWLTVMDTHTGASFTMRCWFAKASEM